ncbi:hypothetical protein O0547_27235, partial [Brevibacillus laterosporus]|uniref:hypothetical protein n=1 Tax=Brevibacillus laterosporus TaxID=1465 RepID=UPI0022A7DD41
PPHPHCSERRCGSDDYTCSAIGRKKTMYNGPRDRGSNERLRYRTETGGVLDRGNGEKGGIH